MDETIFDKVQEIDLKKTMEQSYIDYAMSVISQRALPDVRRLKASTEKSFILHDRVKQRSG